MLLKRKKNNALSFFDDRGFKVSVSKERLNRIYVFADTEVEDYVVDAHFAVLDRYHSYLLSLSLKRSKLDVVTREILSVDRIKWNLAKIYRTIEHVGRRISKILDFNKLKGQGGEAGNE